MELESWAFPISILAATETLITIPWVMVNSGTEYTACQDGARQMKLCVPSLQNHWAKKTMGVLKSQTKKMVKSGRETSREVNVANTGMHENQPETPTRVQCSGLGITVPLRISENNNTPATRTAYFSPEKDERVFYCLQPTPSLA